MASSTFVTVGVDVVAEGGVAMCTMGVDEDAVGAVALCTGCKNCCCFYAIVC